MSAPLKTIYFALITHFAHLQEVTGHFSTCDVTHASVVVKNNNQDDDFLKFLLPIFRAPERRTMLSPDFFSVDERQNIFF